MLKSPLPHRLRRKRPCPDITAEFQRWYGRALRWWERKAIYTLERQRRAGLTIRAQIIDWPGTDTTPVLTAYINWLLTRAEWAEVSVVSKTTKEAKEIAKSINRKQVFTASHRNADRLRGCNFHICLIHNLSNKDWRTVNSALAPVIPDYGMGCAIIYHTGSGTRTPELPPAFIPQPTIREYKQLHPHIPFDRPESIEADPDPPPNNPCLTTPNPYLLTPNQPIVFYEFAGAAPPQSQRRET